MICVGSHDHSGRAVAALQSMLFPESFLHRMQFAVLRQAFDGRDLRAVGLHGEHRARLHRLAVELDTVHAPQSDVSQPTCVPVSPSTSRR